MPTQIVVTVFRYEAETPEEAAAAVRQSEERYEGNSLVFAASSPGELPHPTQVRGFAEAFGE